MLGKINSVPNITCVNWMLDPLCPKLGEPELKKGKHVARMKRSGIRGAVGISERAPDPIAFHPGTTHSRRLTKSAQNL